VSDDSSPRARIDAERARVGDRAFVGGCLALLSGDEVDVTLLRALGGPAAERFIADPARDDDYWLRVWAARGLLWCADATAQPAVAGALRDEHWRVREMALKVIARQHWGDLVDAVVPLEGDPVPRVRASAERTLRVLTTARD
jgi:hypothetical protein